MHKNELRNLTIAVSGASGFIGRNLVYEASKRGIEVQAFSRSPDAIPNGENITVTELEETGLNYESWKGKADVFVHLAGRAHVLREKALDPYEEFRRANVLTAIKAAKEAFNRRVRRFIYVSSVGVHGTSCNDGPLSPASPLHPEADYAASKLEAEVWLKRFSLEHKWDVVIIRPPLVYGPGLKGNLFRLLRLADTWAPLPFAGIDNKRSFLGVRNCIDFILYIAKTNDLSNGVYIPADREIISTSMLVEQMRSYCGRKASLFSMPRVPTKVACRIFGRTNLFRQLFESLWVDYRDLYKETGWEPPYSQVEQLSDTVEWFLENRS